VHTEAIRKCYERLNYDQPNISRDMARLAERNPAELLRAATGYRLEARARAALDAKYGQAVSSIAVAQLLAELPSKVPAIHETDFLREALSCYRVKAFRAAIVMVWNLAFDHVLHWLLADPARLQTFNARIPVRFPNKRHQIQIVSFDDFEDLKESEVIEVASSAGLLTGDVVKILQKELTRHQAEGSITDLVNNVVLKL
jgi:hypothetical protein